MILIIAEKPSLGRNIVSGIGKMSKHEGYYEGSGYIVTWVFGHLFSLADIEAYGSSADSLPDPGVNNRWTLKNLPCFPTEFKFEMRRGDNKKLDAGVIKQFDIIKSQCNRDDTDIIVNAGDADREGEIIVRICMDKAFINKPVNKTFKRLWLPDQTPETIAKALSEMKSESEYDNLANEGFARTYIDWLYGVNLTRYATLKTGTLLRVGRVIVPIVRAIYDRDMAIKNFVPDIYYAVISSALTDGEVIELQSMHKFSKNEIAAAQALCDQYNKTDAVVTSVKRKKDTLAPGKLFSLSKLQNILGKKHKMSMADSLAIVQKLYEEGYVTYPRTNSEYLATAEQEKVKQIIENIAKIGYPVEFKNSKSIFDDSKIESHSALTPTYKIPDKNKLTPDEAKVYSTIFRRFAAVFCAEPCIVDKTEIKIENGEEFILKGMVIIEPGWTKYDDYSAKDKVLPKLKKGDKITTDFKPVEKETNPPRHFTIETLNNYLKNPFREDKAAKSTKIGNNVPADNDSIDENVNADDEAEYKAIFEGLELGTEATRTGIIDNARNSKYIQLKKDVYTIMPDGIYLVESLTHMQIGIDKYKTAELGKALKKVYRGELTVKESTVLAQREIAEVFNKKETAPEKDTDNGFFGDIVGKCPSCGGDVVRTKYGYGCNKYKTGCKFTVSGVICGRVISVSNVRTLLEKGATSKIVGFTSKKGKAFDAVLKLDNDKVVFNF